MNNLIAEVETDEKPFLPVIEEFRNHIETDPEIFMQFNLMFEQVPHKPPYNKDPTGKPQVRSYHHMLQLLNKIMTKSLEFDSNSFVGIPICTIFGWPMGTPAGSAAFLNVKVNRQLKKILNEWAIFLSSENSRYVLNSDPHKGWFGKDAQKELPDFDKEFICNPELPYHGFKSWDDFFTREFKNGKRPVASPDDDSVIVNACESSPYRIAKNIKRLDKFWIKAQSYSLDHMLAGDQLSDNFVGGTVYQGFLSALNYHRWHSPVCGKIVKTCVIDGSYYSEALSEGFDPTGENESQGYIVELATRALIFIEADNTDIGLMCIILVGMTEISSCQITVYEGQHVSKGDQIGMFHYGGSSHCLLFGPHVKLDFDLHGCKPGLNSKNIPVNARIATVYK
ncbi:MAG: phosphatidylserine decarboxylase family protein [Bacteroidia bacterium]|nr:phosphatidylserine decarboxylase family protein [Bacteroidia bacterium]